MKRMESFQRAKLSVKEYKRRPTRVILDILEKDVAKVKRDPKFTRKVREKEVEYHVKRHPVRDLDFT